MLTLERIYIGLILLGFSLSCSTSQAGSLCIEVLSTKKHEEITQSLSGSSEFRVSISSDAENRTFEFDLSDTTPFVGFTREMTSKTIGTIINLDDASYKDFNGNDILLLTSDYKFAPYLKGEIKLKVQKYGDNLSVAIIFKMESSSDSTEVLDQKLDDTIAALGLVDNFTRVTATDPHEYQILAFEPSHREAHFLFDFFHRNVNVY